MAARVITSENMNALGGQAGPRTLPAVPSLRTWLDRVRTRYARHRLYRQTVAALTDLDDRVLADIGVGRHEIEQVAWTMSQKALR